MRAWSHVIHCAGVGRTSDYAACPCSMWGVQVEKLVIDKWKGANWRLSCRTVVGVKNEAATVRFKLQPQKGFQK